MSNLLLLGLWTTLALVLLALTGSKYRAWRWPSLVITAGGAALSGWLGLQQYYEVNRIYGMGRVDTWTLTIWLAVTIPALLIAGLRRRHR